MTITEIKSYRVKTYEVATINQKYYLDITLNDSNEIVQAYLKNPIICSLDDLNILKQIIIKLEEYNWES